MRVMLRGVFILMIAAIPLAHWFRYSGEHGAEPQPRVNFAALGLSAEQQLPDGTWALTAQGCAQPVFAAAASLVGAELTAARHVLARPGLLKTVFLGQTSDGFSASTMAWRWMQATARHVIGLASGKVPQTAVFLRLPASCPQLNALQWSLLSPAG
jgi:hypothetical protein